MSCESPKEEKLLSPRKRGLIHFNPKFSRQSGSPERSESTPSSAFPKPRKYFDSADFFMREEMKNHNSAGDSPSQKKGELNGEKTHHTSSLASECQTVNSAESTDPVNKNVVPLILLRRSKSSAMINSADGTDDEPENLPTTVEALNGPSNREIPAQNSSGESSPSESHDGSRSNSPSQDKTPSPRTREEVRSLLIPRLTKTPSHEESSLASSPKNVGSPLRNHLGDESTGQL